MNADSHADQKHWYDAILDEIDGANDAVFRAQGIANKGMQTWFDRKSEERREALSSLQKGLKMRKHYMAMGFHKVHDRIVKVDEKGQSIYWYDPAAPTVPGGGKEITNRVPIESIVSVQYGAETVALSTLASKSEDSLRCFSICTAEKTYDFECDSHDARNEFAGNLEKVREHAERCEVGEEVAIRKQHMEKKDKLRSSMSKSQAIMKQQNRRTAVNPNLINSSMEINNS